jgi:hypothetical protein
MSKEDLLQKKVVIEQRFDELTKTKSEAEDEMKRLQGEYRLVVELINTSDDKPKRLRKVIPDAQS